MTEMFAQGDLLIERVDDVEPGLYFDTFGVRTEINMYRGERDAVVTGARQSEIRKLLE